MKLEEKTLKKCTVAREAGARLLGKLSSSIDSSQKGGAKKRKQTRPKQKRFHKKLRHILKNDIFM